jgi:molecular chaperone DnaK (HSP70)
MEIKIDTLTTVLLKEQLEKLRKKRKDNRQVKKWTEENFKIDKECSEQIERIEKILRQREEDTKADGV